LSARFVASGCTVLVDERRGVDREDERERRMRRLGEARGTIDGVPRRR
jgi:hypothetical protein